MIGEMLEEAIETAFAEAVAGLPDALKGVRLTDSVGQRQAKPYAVRIGVPGGNSAQTFSDGDTALTVEPVTMQISIVVDTGRADCWTIVRAVDRQFLLIGITLSDGTVGVRRLIPPVVTEIDSPNSNGKIVNMGVLRYEFNVDNLLA